MPLWSDYHAIKRHEWKAGGNGEVVWGSKEKTRIEIAGPLEESWGASESANLLAVATSRSLALSV